MKVDFHCAVCPMQVIQETLLNTGGATQHMHLQLLPQEKIAGSHNANEALSPGSNTWHFIPISRAKASHMATQGREVRCYHMSKERRTGFSVYSLQEGVRVPLATQGSYVWGEIWVWLVFKVERGWWLWWNVCPQLILCALVCNPPSKHHLQDGYSSLQEYPSYPTVWGLSSKFCSRITSFMKLSIDNLDLYHW